MGRVNVYYDYVRRWVQRERDVPGSFITPSIVKEALYSLLWHWLKYPEIMEMISMEIERLYQKRNIKLLSNNLYNQKPPTLVEMEKKRIERLIGELDRAINKDDLEKAMNRYYYELIRDKNEIDR